MSVGRTWTVDWFANMFPNLSTVHDHWFRTSRPLWLRPTPWGTRKAMLRSPRFSAAHRPQTDRTADGCLDISCPLHVRYGIHGCQYLMAMVGSRWHARFISFLPFYCSLKKVPCHHGQCGAKGCQCLPCWKGKSCDTLGKSVTYQCLLINDLWICNTFANRFQMNVGLARYMKEIFSMNFISIPPSYIFLKMSLRAIYISQLVRSPNKDKLIDCCSGINAERVIATIAKSKVSSLTLILIVPLIYRDQVTRSIA